MTKQCKYCHKLAETSLAGNVHRLLEISCCSPKTVTGGISYGKRMEFLIHRSADGSLSGLWCDTHLPSGRSWNSNCKNKNRFHRQDLWKKHTFFQIFLV